MLSIISQYANHLNYPEKAEGISVPADRLCEVLTKTIGVGEGLRELLGTL